MYRGREASSFNNSCTWPGSKTGHSAASSKLGSAPIGNVRQYSVAHTDAAARSLDDASEQFPREKDT